MQAKMYVLYTKVLILLQLLHKQETWEQKVHICDHQALYLVCSGKCLRKSVLKIFSCFCLFLLPITNILNVSSHIIQKNKNQGNTSWQTYSLSSTKSSVFFLSQTELWFSRHLHCKGHTTFSLSKQESNLKYKQTHKNLSRGKEYCKEQTEEKVLQRQNATVACFLHRWRSWLWGSMFMGLACDISWGSPWHELQKYSPYPVLQGFYYFETHFLSTLLNIIP